MFFPKAGLVGAILAILMIVGILSFLATTPEAWVSDLGAERGFSSLSGARRLVVKDIAILVGRRSCSPNRGISRSIPSEKCLYITVRMCIFMTIDLILESHRAVCVSAVRRFSGNVGSERFAGILGRRIAVD